MALDDPQSVDAIGIDTGDGAVVLNLIDGWDWSTPAEHIAALREKLEAYLNFALSGQILEVAPEAKGRKVRIEATLKHEPPIEAVRLFDHVRVIAKEYGVDLLWMVSQGST